MLIHNTFVVKKNDFFYLHVFIIRKLRISKKLKMLRPSSPSCVFILCCLMRILLQIIKEIKLNYQLEM